MQCAQPDVVCLQAWLPARTYVREALETRREVDGSGEIIKLSRYCPWKEHLYELEQELSVDPLIKFCLYEVCAPPCHMRHNGSAPVLKRTWDCDRSRWRLKRSLLSAAQAAAGAAH